MFGLTFPAVAMTSTLLFAGVESDTYSYFNFTVNGNAGILSDTQYLACGPRGGNYSYDSGCEATGIWTIDGTCRNALLYVTILMGDYGSTSEYVDVVLDYNYGDAQRCYGLTHECNGTSTTCEFDQSGVTYYRYQCDYGICNYTEPYIDLSKYIHSNETENSLTVTLDASNNVDGFCYGADNYVVRGYVAIICDIYGNLTYAPSDMPTEKPTQSPTGPTESPTNKPTQLPTNATIDYYFYVDGSTGTFSDTEYLACGPRGGNYSGYESGCDATGVWKIIGTCNNPVLSVYALKGDYGSSSEYFNVVLDYDDDNEERCYGLDSECNSTTECVFYNGNGYNSSGSYYLDISDYIDSDKKSNILTVTLNATDTVDGFCNGANNYVVRAYVTITCGIYGNFTYAPTEMPTGAPTQSPTNATIDYFFSVDGSTGTFSDTEYLACGPRGNYSGYESGCEVTGVWKISGTCNNPVLSVFALAGDYGSSSEYFNVILDYDDNNEERCYGLDSECNYTTECLFYNSNGYSYYLNLSNYIDSDEKSNILSVTLDATDPVDGFCSGANDYVIRAYVTIMCDIYGNYTYSPTLMPTEMPTQSPTGPTPIPTNKPTMSPTNDTINRFYVVQDGGVSSSTGYLACGPRGGGNYSGYESGCDATGIWKIKGYCYNATLSAEILIGDYGSPYEYVNVELDYDLGNEYRCYGLNSECGNGTNCTFDNSDDRSTYLDISDYIDEDQWTNWLTVTLNASDDVDGFCYGADSYVVRGFVTISCVGGDEGTPDDETTTTESADDSDSTKRNFNDNGLSCLLHVILVVFLFEIYVQG